MTNAQRVKQWMEALGQGVPEQPGMSAQGRDLRITLLTEEAEEAHNALEDIEESGLVPAAKELADVLVIAYGSLVSMGVDPDRVFEIVQDENDMKLKHVEVREDGKRVVSDDVKKRLKEQTQRRLEALINSSLHSV
jgi:predicted HAD superfamily Cof-like phosphohydrolase